MESRRVGLVWVILSLFVVFHRTKAENITDPTDNLNLTPFDGWRSAHWCLKKTTTCLAEYVLTEEGVLKPDEIDAKVYCEPGGCADQTRKILLCVHRSKRDYWFVNKATVKDINDTINKICTSPSG